MIQRVEEILDKSLWIRNIRGESLNPVLMSKSKNNLSTFWGISLLVIFLIFMFSNAVNLTAENKTFKPHFEITLLIILDGIVFIGFFLFLLDRISFDFISREPGIVWCALMFIMVLLVIISRIEISELSVLAVFCFENSVG